MAARRAAPSALSNGDNGKSNSCNRPANQASNWAMAAARTGWVTSPCVAPVSTEGGMCRPVSQSSVALNVSAPKGLANLAVADARCMAHR